MHPPLTAVSQPLVSIGNLAVDLLVQWIDGKKPDPLENVPLLRARHTGFDRPRPHVRTRRGSKTQEKKEQPFSFKQT